MGAGVADQRRLGRQGRGTALMMIGRLRIHAVVTILRHFCQQQSVVPHAQIQDNGIKANIFHWLNIAARDPILTSACLRCMHEVTTVPVCMYL
jgi:hypothetical protein